MKKPRKDCPYCRGDGGYIVPGHDPNCDGTCVNCPIPVQEQCACEEESE